MAVVEQKLSKVAHTLYADSAGDATYNSNNSLTGLFSERFHPKISVFLPVAVPQL
jgi:hypothetical protein